MAVEQQADARGRTVGGDGRHADAVGGIEDAVSRDREAHRAQKARWYEAALAAIAENFGDATVDEMRDEKAIVRGQDQIIETGTDGGEYGSGAALQVELENLAGSSLGRNHRPFAVDFDRCGYAEVTHKAFWTAAFEWYAPDFVRADRREVDVAVRSDRERV